MVIIVGCSGLNVNHKVWGRCTRSFCYNLHVPRRKKKPERPVFDSIRKPTAPPSQKIGEDKPDDRVYPSGKRQKHKKEKDGDLFEE